MIARGDAGENPGPPIPSPLGGVSDEAWTRLVHALAVRDLGEVTESNALGCFEMRLRRLADLGLVRDLVRVKYGNGKVWKGTFEPPLTLERFLASPVAQYNALAESLTRYDAELTGLPTPEGATRSGRLAILHCAGPSGLAVWEKHKFPSTVAVYERANGIF